MDFEVISRQISEHLLGVGQSSLKVFCSLLIALLILVLGLYLSRWVGAFIKKVLNKISFDDKTANCFEDFGGLFFTQLHFKVREYCKCSTYNSSNSYHYSKNQIHDFCFHCKASLVVISVKPIELGAPPEF